MLRCWQTWLKDDNTTSCKIKMKKQQWSDITLQGLGLVFVTDVAFGSKPKAATGHSEGVITALRLGMAGLRSMVFFTVKKSQFFSMDFRTAISREKKSHWVPNLNTKKLLKWSPKLQKTSENRDFFSSQAERRLTPPSSHRNRTALPTLRCKGSLHHRWRKWKIPDTHLLREKLVYKR